MVRRLTFTVAREPVEIEVGGETFHAPPVIPPTVLGELADKADETGVILRDTQMTQRQSIEQALKAVDEVMTLVLLPESADRFRERLFSLENPFHLQREIMPLLPALIEEYTDRPTRPSPPSTRLQASDGHSSTDGALAEASTPSTLTGAASAT